MKLVAFTLCAALTGCASYAQPSTSAVSPIHVPRVRTWHGPLQVIRDPVVEPAPTAAPSPATCDWFVGGPRPDQLPITVGPQRLCGIGLRPAWPDDRR